MPVFIVSIVAGCLFPLLPLLTEFGLKNAVTTETWALTGVVYVAAVGIVSRNQAVAISSFLFAAICAVIYGAAAYGEGHADMPFVKYGSTISEIVIAAFATMYAIERYGRHCVDAEPFLEFT